MESIIKNSNAARHKRQRRRRRGGRKLEHKDNSVEPITVATALLEATEQKSTKNAENFQQPQLCDIAAKGESAEIQLNAANSANKRKRNKKKKKKSKPSTADEQSSSANSGEICENDENNHCNENSGCCSSFTNETQDIDIFCPDFNSTSATDNKTFRVETTEEVITSTVTHPVISQENSELAINELLRESEAIVLCTNANTAETDTDNENQSEDALNLPLSDLDFTLVLQRLLCSLGVKFDDDDSFRNFLYSTPHSVENNMSGEWFDDTNITTNDCGYESRSTCEVPEMFPEYPLLTLINDAKAVVLNLLSNMKGFTSNESHINQLNEILQILQKLQMRYIGTENTKSPGAVSSNVVCVRRGSSDSLEQHSPNGKRLSRLEQFLLIKSAFEQVNDGSFSKHHFQSSTPLTDTINDSAIMDQSVVVRSESTQNISTIQRSNRNLFSLFAAAYFHLVLSYARLDATYYIIFLFSLILIGMFCYFGIV